MRATPGEEEGELEEAADAEERAAGTSMQLAAACVVCSALVRDRSARVRFCDAGGLELLAPLLTSPDLKVAYCAAMVYACLGYSAECTAAVARSGTALSTVPPVLERLRELLDLAAASKVRCRGVA
jgi:hypothetical protein